MDAPVNSPQPDLLVRAKSIAIEAYDKTSSIYDNAQSRGHKRDDTED